MEKMKVQLPLIPHSLYSFPGGSDEYKTSFDASSGERRVLAQLTERQYFVPQYTLERGSVQSHTRGVCSHNRTA